MNRELAQEVCHKLDIEFKEVNFSKNYWNHVFSYLLESYSNGLTPNPDIMCNKWIKFGTFVDYCLNELKMDVISTGHYAGTSYGDFWQHYDSERTVHLLRPKDKRKDQTLFLSQISQTSLKKVMFPLQQLCKSEVKSIAKQNGLTRVAERPESQGICFIGKRNFQKFIEQYIEPKPGKFIDIDTGVVVGSHEGIHFWTIGQNCRIGGMKHKYFVAKKDVQNHIMYVASNTNHSSLYSNQMIVKNMNWICCEPMAITARQVFECEFRFQHRDQPQPCRLIKLDDNQFNIQLYSSTRALTEGQFAVIYKDNECLGSAQIDRYWLSSQL
ncbi:unnamed protein product [Medioppia subpectinata]|uniref:tRNA-5-taurinomethyluridine 2-sulfurtransferase n=1 Tax=Medioppia subpectinata TaxID=1979941 RepID=A0A7R9Q653_9ACAR|nr:unnamed protein product [Medioppia subpectinata]CAG2114183.1 unnamed protein product [Medioppia subpectinata]